MSITIRGRVIETRHMGLLVVVFALLVTAPRLTLTFIMSDNLKLNPAVEFWTLVLSAVAGSVVLTLGNAYLTHILASHFNRRDALSWLLAGAWVLYLCFTTIIIAPALMVGVRQSALADVLPHMALQWTWCIIAALCFEFLVAGSMAAYAIASRAPIVSLPRVTVTEDDAPHRDMTQPDAPITQPSARQQVFLMLDAHQGDINDAALADAASVSASTVRNYRAAWRKQRVIPNGNSPH
jgi:hypothetical protein